MVDLSDGIEQSGCPVGPCLIRFGNTCSVALQSMKHEKRSGVLTVAKESVKFSPKSLASSAVALRHGPASALAIANIKEADRGNITGASSSHRC